VSKLYWIAGVLLAAVVGGVVASRLVKRRRRNGMVRLADAIPVHSKWWRNERKKQGELLYVAIGDSAAQGIGASLPSRGYVGIIAAHIKSATGRSVRVVNLSQSGGRLREVIENQLPALERLRPDILTLAIGANDIPTFDADRFEREAQVILKAMPKHALVADLPSFYFGRAERKAKTASAIVRRLADERGLRTVPLHKSTRKQGAPKTALRDVAADFFHPNDRGYRIWASAFLPAVGRRLQELSEAQEPDATRGRHKIAASNTEATSTTIPSPITSGSIPAAKGG
jgi:lysophospholipase L1-like esterase